MEKQGCLELLRAPRSYVYFSSLARVFHVFHTIQMRCLCALIRYGYKRMCSSIYIASIAQLLYKWVHNKNMCRCRCWCVCVCCFSLCALFLYSLAFFQPNHFAQSKEYEENSIRFLRLVLLLIFPSLFFCSSAAAIADATISAAAAAVFLLQLLNDMEKQRKQFSRF